MTNTTPTATPDWAATAAEQGQRLIRMRFALKIIREFCMENYDSTVFLAMRGWIDGGMLGPVPWPRSPFFDDWAEKQGWRNVDGFVGFRVTMQLCGEQQ